jgi:hypothetical protein
MNFEKFEEIAKKYNLEKKNDGEYTLPDVHPSDFIMRYVYREGVVNMAMEIEKSEGSSKGRDFHIEFCGCHDIEDYRVELKLQYLLHSYKLLQEELRLEKVKKDF